MAEGSGDGWGAPLLTIPLGFSSSQGREKVRVSLSRQEGKRYVPIGASTGES
jgi:hypothetical protein